MTGRRVPQQCPESCPAARFKPVDWIANCMNLKPFLRLAGVLALTLGATATSCAAETAATPAPQPAPGGFTVDKLADGVYAAIRTDPPGLMVDANSLFIVNDSDVVVVDAPEASAEMIAALKTLTDKPVSYLVNTHWHDDHVIGNAVWRNAYPSIQFVGHAALREYLPTTGA